MFLSERLQYEDYHYTFYPLTRNASKNQTGSDVAEERQLPVY
jgi:hypothetical protein